MHFSRQIIFGALMIAALPLAAQTSAPKPKNQRPPSPKVVASSASNRGQQVFEQNCSRCHNAPEGFPPSISGTVAMHMRVRANLSEADYKALRRFFIP